MTRFASGLALPRVTHTNSMGGVGADDDDTRKESAQRTRQAAIDELYSALAGLQTERDQLDIAIQNQDSEDAEIAAHAAASSWLAAKSALQRLPETIDDVALAAFALGAAHRTIVDQFNRVAARIATPSLHRFLRRPKLGLAIAHGEPPCSDTQSP